MNTSSRKEKEKNRKGGEGKRGDEKVELMNGVYKGLGDLSPHELQPVGEKLTESVAQPCSILCTANHNFKISTSECIRYPPKCAFSRVSNDFFFGGGDLPPFPVPHPPRRILALSTLNLRPKILNETKIGTPTFRNKVTPL